MRRTFSSRGVSVLSTRRVCSDRFIEMTASLGLVTLVGATIVGAGVTALGVGPGFGGGTGPVTGATTVRNTVAGAVAVRSAEPGARRARRKTPKTTAASRRPAAREMSHTLRRRMSWPSPDSPGGGGADGGSNDGVAGPPSGGSEVRMSVCSDTGNEDRTTV
jgi:hypothetical protein